MRSNNVSFRAAKTARNPLPTGASSFRRGSFAVSAAQDDTLMNINDVRALVTGGSSGIAKEIARQLRARGVQVVICGRDAAKPETAAREIDAIPIRADVAVDSEGIALVQQTIERLGDYNVLVNNAGFGTFGSLVSTTVEEMQRGFATNVFGPMG